MKETPIKQLVQRNDWQELRKSFISTWKKNPKENVKKLREWLGTIEDADYEKLRIVMNYLTGSGFRSGKIKHPAIQRLRDDISDEMKRRQKNGMVTREQFLKSYYTSTN